jgi:hypothetical protein
MDAETLTLFSPSIHFGANENSPECVAERIVDLAICGRI